VFKRVFFASGPGDIIATHNYWKRHQDNPSQVSVTFSSQVEQFCADMGAASYLISSHARREKLQDGAFTLEHRPKRQRFGAAYHLEEVRYGLSLLLTALRFRAQLALVDSGTTHYFVLTLFRLCGIRVICLQHNSLWPAGFPPRKLIPRLVQSLDRLFWRWIPSAVIAVSPECERQVSQLRGSRARYPIVQMRAQFDPQYFAQIPPPPPHDARPFRITYVGRIERNKGVFDVLEIARKIENSDPGLVRWEVCGSGSQSDALVQAHKHLDLEGVVTLRGWTSPQDLIGVHARSHASIVPTRSSFIEGLAMTAAESVLAGRPVVTNPAVPALEVLRDACAEAKTDDVESHAAAVRLLATDRAFYERRRAACAEYQAQFYDSSFGLTAALKGALDARIAAALKKQAARITVRSVR